MKTVEKTISTTTERGTKVTLTVIAVRGWEKRKEVNFSDGWNVEVERMREVKETKMTIEFNSQKFDGHLTTFINDDLREKGCYAAFQTGNANIGLSEKVYNALYQAVSEAEKEAETDPDWVKYQEKVAAAKRAEEEYERDCRKIENAMTLNGKSY